MTETISTLDFHQAVADKGWRLIAGGPAAYFVTSSYATGAALVQAITDLGHAGDQEPHVDLRPAGVTVQLPILGPEGEGFGTDYLQLAERISAAADELGLTADPSQLQTVQLCVDALQRPAVAAFWRAVLGGYIDRDHEYDLIDPRWRSPALNVQQMDAPRPQRNRIHVDLYLPYDQAVPRVQAALAAGGHIVSDEPAPGWWILGDSEGNEICIVPVGGLPGEPPIFA